MATTMAVGVEVDRDEEVGGWLVSVVVTCAEGAGGFTAEGVDVWRAADDAELPDAIRAALEVAEVERGLVN